MSRRNTAADFWARTVPNGACRDWTGRVNPDGYGMMKWQGKDVRVHRLAFFLRMDRWPDSDIRHLCSRPVCVLHVVEGTRSENTLDSVAFGTHPQARKTHCPQNHPYDETNTYYSAGRRHCRECVRNHVRNYRQRQRALR